MFEKLGYRLGLTLILFGLLGVVLALLFTAPSLSVLFLPASIVFLFTGFIIFMFLAPAKEILESNKETNWKILWITVLFFLSAVGFMAYLLLARKDLKK